MARIRKRQLLSKVASIQGFDKLVRKSLLLYAVFSDSDTPVWVKTAIVAALVYLIDPLDAVPDLTPAIGFVDDMAVILACLKSIDDQIKPRHEKRARKLAHQ